MATARSRPAGQVLLQSHAELIIDPPVVANHPLGVEQKHLRGPYRGELVGDVVVGILQHGKRQLVFQGIRRDFLRRVLHVGVDGNKSDTAFGIFGCQSIEPGRIELGQRAFGADKRDDHEPGIAQIGQGMFLARGIGETEIGRLFSNQLFRRHGAVRKDPCGAGNGNAGNHNGRIDARPRSPRPGIRKHQAILGRLVGLSRRGVC